MKTTIRMVHPQKREQLSSTSAFGVRNAEKALAFHRSFPDYRMTPLVELNNLAAQCGIRGIYVKDESFRFGLNAFKALGGSYAIGCEIADRLGKDISELPYDRLTGEEVKKTLGSLTLITATDGNHGRGVAWTARQLGQSCVVYMPRGSAPERLRNIQLLGAEASVTDLSYDAAVAKAAADAEQNGWVLIQDTAWDGYEEVPRRIMQGYTTMGMELVQQLQQVRPTHVFLQAGVGAMAGAITGFLADYYGESSRPVITIVEPDRADCIYRTAEASDGTLHTVTTEMNTIMAGLACGVPCSIGWEILRDHADFFVSMPDQVAALGMRILGNPLGNDQRIISGESGAAGFGFAMELLLHEEQRDLREKLKMDENSVVLCISTEGDTDRENYRRIVWDGAYPADSAADRGNS